jgi:hypothetical protein
MISVRINKTADGCIAMLSPSLWIILELEATLPHGRPITQICSKCKTRIRVDSPPSLNDQDSPPMELLLCDCLTLVVQAPMQRGKVLACWDPLIRQKDRILIRMGDIEG